METNTELTPIQLKIINGVANTFSLGEAIDQAGANRTIVTEWRHTAPPLTKPWNEPCATAPL